MWLLNSPSTVAPVTINQDGVLNGFFDGGDLLLDVRGVTGTIGKANSFITASINRKAITRPLVAHPAQWVRLRPPADCTSFAILSSLDPKKTVAFAFRDAAGLVRPGIWTCLRQAFADACS